MERLTSAVAKTSTVSSEMERIAEKAEREVDDLKKAEYMHAHLGEEYEGVISSVTNFGLFVELPNTIEGLIHIRTLNEDVEYDERRMILTSHTHGTLQLGDRVKVQVASVDVDNREINFEFLGRVNSDGKFTKRQDQDERAGLDLGNSKKSKSKRPSSENKDQSGKKPGFFQKKKAAEKEKKSRHRKKRRK